MRTAKFKVDGLFPKGTIQGTRGSHPTWLCYKDALRLDPCSYCGEPGGEWDHIVPKVKGGSQGTYNITGSCAACNRAKSAKPAILFLLEKFNERNKPTNCVVNSG